MTSIRNPLIAPDHKANADDAMPTLNLNFRHFPAYAQFILENKLQEFVTEQLSLSREIKLPLLKFLAGLSEEELFKIGKKTATELLTCCANDKLDDYIQASVEKWVNNQLPVIVRSQLIAEDITLVNFMRRKLFRHFLTCYTSDINLALEILNEIDRFTVKIETISSKNFLDAQQQVFTQAQTLAHIGNWQWDLPTKKLTWSDELFNIYELELQSPLTSENIAMYNHPDDAALIEKYMQWSVRTLEPHDFYYRIILKDGRQKVLHAKGEVKLNSKGMPTELFGTLQDVTDQKQKEKELEESRKFIQKIADVSPGIITVFNIHSLNYLFINKAQQTLMGYHSEEFMQKGRAFFNSLIHPDDIHYVKQRIDELINEPVNNKETAAEKIKSFKYRLKHKDGDYRWLHTFTTVFNRDKNNNVQDILNISIDITESELLTLQLAAKNAEIRRKEIQHQRMINEIEDYAILLMDREGFIQNWNKGAEKIKGYSASEVIGKNFRIFYSKEDQESKLPESLIEKAINEGKARHEGWRVRKDGTHFWGNVVITAIHDENNNIIGFSKVTRNLTEKKLAEDEQKENASRIQKHNEELQRINKDLESFTYMASHDLQEPLRKIQVFSNLIANKEQENFSAETKTYFDRIIAASVRMQTLIESLLYYSRVTTTEVLLESTDLNAVIAEIKQDLSHVITEKNVTIVAKSLPVIRVMPMQIHQLFLNIIENAIKYSHRDTHPVINISSEFIKPKKNLKKDPYYNISISDNGIGFEQEYAENIFKLFQRLHGRSEYSGTGVGLAICKRIVENHKGSITATGKPGKGATFTVTLPAG